MVQADGIRLFDFGGARAVERSDSYRSAMVVRKKGFSPVEQVYNEKQGPWTDIYALAATIYFSITGIVPPESIVRMMEEDTLQPPSALGADISPAQERALLKALAIKSKDRYQTVEEFRKALYEPAEESRTDVSRTTENALSKFVKKTEYTSEENKEKKEKELKNQEIRTPAPKKSQAGLILILCLVAVCFFAVGGFIIMRKAIKDSRKRQDVESFVSVESLSAMSETGSSISESEAISETTMDDETAASVTEPVSDSKENDNYVIDWKGVNIEKAVREVLGISDRAITHDDVKDVTELKLEGKGIAEISDLVEFENLTKLNFGDNRIKDIRALSALTNLKELNLWGNEITDVSALSGLTNLTKLSLSNNQISDLSALSGLTNLKYLYLNENQLTDLSALSDLTNLFQLEMNNNQITDVSPLSGLKNLQILCIRDNPVTDLSPLDGLNIFSVSQ